jgi:hypothetical protein
MLDTLLTLGFPDCPKFQTKNKAYKNPEHYSRDNELQFLPNPELPGSARSKRGPAISRGLLDAWNWADRGVRRS